MPRVSKERERLLLGGQSEETLWRSHLGEEIEEWRAGFLLSRFGRKGEERRKTQNWVNGIKSEPV